MIKKTLASSLIASSLLLGQSAFAYEAGDFMIKAGAALVDPREDSDDIKIKHPALGAAPGAQVGLDSDTQLGLQFTYMATERIGIELLAATPFSHNIDATGSINGVGKLGDTKHLPPTLTVQYYLADPEDKFQPYIGAGINYTNFFDEDTSSNLTNSIGALAGLAEPSLAGAVTATSTKMNLDDSWGAALQVGFNFEVTENMGVTGSFYWIDIDTTAKINAKTNVGNVTAKVHVDVDPYVYMLGGYYKF